MLVGKNDQYSDLDILIDIQQPLDLLESIGREQALTEKLGSKVDLITLRSLPPPLKEYVENDLIPIVQRKSIRS